MKQMKTIADIKNKLQADLDKKQADLNGVKTVADMVQEAVIISNIQQAWDNWEVYVK